MSQNCQEVEEQVYLINCTQTLCVHSLQQTHLIKCPSGLYCHNEGLEHTTWNVPYYSSVFSISLPQLAQWLVYSLLLISPPQYPKFSLTWGAGPCKPHTPITILPSSFARTNLISYKIQTLFST